ncbi:sensor histidine kinase [Clostridium guangxiense]|uniref:sensor histidine kinase n=1 Tax=Clostridium guangxiense TaxID=1662055 RepID=UPI001E2DAFEA|nr:HAMP domain-containing histidine kinase [Clostridium guangxiense]
MKKINIKNSITAKLFLITLSFFTVFIVFILLFESIFFQKIYENKRKDNLNKAAINFKNYYNNELNKMNSNDIADYMKEFEEKNDCTIAILNSYGNLKYLTSRDNDESNSTDINRIKEIMYKWVSDPGSFIDMKRTGKSKTYVFESKVYNMKNIVSVVPDTTTNEYIFAISSFTPITEASDVMKGIFIYVFIGGIILVLIMAFIYSNMITKPLVKINKAASKMANLDFDEKCSINREDEIGSIGRSLNFLSNNLNNALNSLKNANEKLKKDIEKEKALEKMRKEFIAGVSHELKTPVGLIEGYAEGLKDNIVTSEEDREYYLNVIIDEALNMGNLISDMLDLSQLESGNFKLSKVVIDIGDLVWKCYQKYCTIFNERGIELDINIINVNVIADKYRIEQVLNNYINNALKYVKNKITINMIEKEEEVVVQIINDGEKICEDELDKIWDKFYKIDKSRNRKAGGTGLGLSIVKNIIELHGGKCGAANTENGVEFYFTLNKVQQYKNIAK